MDKKSYESPIVTLIPVLTDIITYSETAEWEGPMVGIGFPDENEGI